MDKFELLSEIGLQYRNHYGETCRCMSWRHKLHHLQLIGVCIGSQHLKEICRAISVNYKYLSAGFPDLLLIRIRTLNPVSNYDHAEERDVNEVKGYKCIDISHWLGNNWKKDNNENEFYDSDLINLQDKDKMNSILIASDDLPVEVDSCEEVSIQGTIDTKTSMGTSSSSARFVCNVADLELLIGNLGISPELTNDKIDDYLVFETLFIEVKGPNDRLAANQKIWQAVLSSAGANVMVGRVRED
jgi:hypothetical protein